MVIGSQATTLPYVVECQSTHPFFETIAAFNVRVAALAYARDCTDANPAYTYRVTTPVPVIENASEAEQRIVGKLVRDMLAAGYCLTIWNGGDEAEIERSADEAAIFAALAASDQDEIEAFHPSSKSRAGWVRLVWGNDADVISDYTTNFEAVLAGANALANELEG